MHIYVKTTLDTDDDAPINLNRLNIEASQTSYVYGNTLSVITTYCGVGKRPKSAKWMPKLPLYENHDYFREIPNLTYFVRIIYSDANLIEEIYLLNVPNGQLSTRFGGVNILQGGKSKNKAKTDFTNIRVLPIEIEKVDAWRNTLIYKRKQ